jgi:two-component system, NarL family, sensor histidine kinase DegS
MTEAPTAEQAFASEIASIDRELAEIDLLISQAGAEAARHEQKRAQAADKMTLLADRKADPKEQLELSAQLTALTRRAALMEGQVEVLEGKRKTLARFRESLARHALSSDPSGPGGAYNLSPDAQAPLPPAVSRIVLSAQEDLRREIARAMHDGPAQSLTNIVLQAQIVERLLATDTARARTEVGLLIGMVQQTLDATKSFIFDVRPMVLDDLGLVPTLRRAARDRGRRAGIPVDFESLGTDRRMPVELESGLFRILDGALAAYLSVAPAAILIRLDWADQVEARVSARRSGNEPTGAEGVDPKTGKKELPPALAAMMEDRKADRQKAVDAARQAWLVVLPDGAWREIQQRASTIGASVQLIDDGSTLVATMDAPEAQPAGPTDKMVR